ncbi:hypothetical protein MMC34_004552 [Xylographa carneopallida]|nr:hypothetical protein [Xylographa carneopallida]
MTESLTTTADNIQSLTDEPPETPAPLFAVRALKSALFGTPALADDEEDDDFQSHAGQHVSTEPFNRPLSPTRFPALSDSKAVAQPSKMDAVLSPAKGILLTPGTGATRRKTVSFGAIADFDKGLGKSRLDQEGGLVGLTGASSPKSSRRLQENRRNEAGLRRTLFDVQGKRSEFKLPKQGRQPEDQPINSPTSKISDPSGEVLIDEADVTVDLKHPISRSGQHWKKEYQRDHEKSKKEMRKLIHYTQAAKSYAIKRDTEALSLSEKLKQALTRSAEMETRVSQLASQLSYSAGQQHKIPSDQVDLLSELATQTANSLRYKQKAEKYRMAIQAQSTLSKGGKELLQSEKRNTTSGNHQASVLHAKRQTDLLESTSFSESQELVQLRNVAEMAEIKAAALMKENLALKNTLARVKQEMNAYEIRNQAREQRRKQKDEKAESQRLGLQEELARYRNLHQPRTKEIPRGNPIDKINGSRTTSTEARILKQHTFVGNLNERYHHFVLPQQDENSPTQFPKILERRKLGPTTAEGNYPTDPWNEQDIRSSSLQESVDTSAGSVEQPKSTSPRDPSLIYDESPLAELKHLMNEGHVQRVRDRTTRAKATEKKVMGSKPLEHVFTVVPAHTLPKLDQESALAPAAVLVSDYKEIPGQDQRAPELIPKSLEASAQVNSQGPFPSQSRSNTLSRLLGNSRASSLSGRPPLPPDRAEAARKRLEQKTARDDARKRT